jgi:hypothetical protein
MARSEAGAGGTLDELGPIAKAELRFCQARRCPWLRLGHKAECRKRQRYPSVVCAGDPSATRSAVPTWATGDTDGSHDCQRRTPIIAK